MGDDPLSTFFDDASSFASTLIGTSKPATAAPIPVYSVPAPVAAAVPGAPLIAGVSNSTVYLVLAGLAAALFLGKKKAA